MMLSVGAPGLAVETAELVHMGSLIGQVIGEGRIWTFHRDSEQKFYMMPQEMLMALGTELSNLLMISDDLCQLIRYSAGYE